MSEETIYVGQQRRTSEWGIWLFEVTAVQTTRGRTRYRVAAAAPHLPPERATAFDWLSAEAVAARFPVVVGGTPPLAGDTAGPVPVEPAGDLPAADPPQPLIPDPEGATLAQLR
jgi:hypothetical protein